MSGHPCWKKIAPNSLEELCIKYQHHSKGLDHSQGTESLESSGKAKSFLFFSIPLSPCLVSFAESAAGEKLVSQESAQDLDSFPAFRRQKGFSPSHHGCLCYEPAVQATWDDEKGQES